MIRRRNFDTLTPEFRLRINNSELPLAAKADITSVCVVNDVDAAGMFSFTLGCWDTAEMKVKWIDDNLLKEGGRVDIEMGYRDNLAKIFTGEITGLEPEFPTDAPPTVTVRGYDRRHRLMSRSNTRTFLNMKDSDMANEIAGEWGLTPEVEDSGVTLDYVLQNNQTDFVFLQERARRIGFEFTVTDTTLYFGPHQNTGSASITLNREVELIDFRARLSTIGQVEALSLKGWSPRDKADILANAGTGDAQAMGGSATGPATVGRAMGGTGSVVVDQPVHSQAEADRIVDGRFKEMALNYVTGHGICIGRPDLLAGRLVEIAGLGERFSGTYYLTKTQHIYRHNTGYRTHFAVRRNAT